MKIPINVRLTTLQYLLSRRQNTPWAWELFTKLGNSWRFFGLQTSHMSLPSSSSHSLEMAIYFRDTFLINMSLTLNDHPRSEGGPPEPPSCSFFLRWPEVVTSSSEQCTIFHFPRSPTVSPTSTRPITSAVSFQSPNLHLHLANISHRSTSFSVNEVST